MSAILRLRSRRHSLAGASAVVALLAAAMLTVAWRPHAQAYDGPVVGSVSNGTSGADVPLGLGITLHVFSGMEEPGFYTTTLADDNTFVFRDLVLEEGTTVVARALHDGVTYVSEFVTVDSDQEDVQLPITIYEATDDPAGVAITQLHLFVSRSGEQLQIGQYCLISNAGDRTYVGRPSSDTGEMVTWQTMLPDGATNLVFDGAELGGRFVVVQGGFADTRPLFPGDVSDEASFTFDLPYSEGISLEQSFDIPVEAVVIVLQQGDGDLVLEGVGLSPVEQLETQMGPASSYRVGPLDSGEPLVFTVVSPELGARAVKPARSSSELALGIAAVAAAGIAAYWMWRPSAPGPMPPEARAQVEAIAALDHEFESGRIPEGQYRQKRRVLKRHLIDELAGR